MLEILDADLRCSRRRLLSVGSLALGGLTLADLMAVRAAAESSRLPDGLVTGKSVIFLFQQGGPSQLETFDPKPEAPPEIRTVTGVTQTSVPGVSFGATLSKLAQLAHKFTVVRSFQTGNGGHNIRPIVGPETLEANLGAMYSRVVGHTHPVTAMPTSAVLFPQAVCPDVAEGKGRGELTATGPFGSAFAPFVPGGNGDLLKNLRLNLATSRFEDRQLLRSQLDQYGRSFDSSPVFDSIDQNTKQATEVLLGQRVADALDLTREDPATVARYDTSGYAKRDGWSKAARGKKGYYTGHAKSLGKALLLARRLCEVGCGFVTVHCGYEGVWDMHADGNNLNMADGMKAVGSSFDHAVAAFIQDVEERGLSDKILLIATGEMGRTPRLNKTGGRDHWARLAPLMMYGAGTSPGRVIGRSTRDAGEAADQPFNSENLIASILQTVLDPGQLRLDPGLSSISRLANMSPIPHLG
jgi:Protein of unknown function (DUF1501)